MKIAYFFDVPDYFGGAGSLLLKQAKLMSEMHNVLVIVPLNKDGIENPKCTKWCDEAGLRHRGLEYTTAFRFRDIDLLDAVERVEAICRLIEEEEIDFLHSTQINVAAELASRKMNIPHLMNIYQLEEEEFLFKQTDIYAHYHLCDSKMYSELWGRNMDLISEYMRPLSPLAKKRECKTRRKECYTIAMVGVLCERKNQLMAIRAVEQLRDKMKIRMVIAGDYENAYGKKCVEYVKCHGLEDIITFRGFVSDVEKVYVESDWFLLTSIDESFPSSAVEAVSFGLTVIATPVAGMPEVFENRKNAFVSENDTLTSIVRAIEDCCNYCNDGRIEEIRKSATETWKREFAPNTHKIKLNEYYNRIVSDFYEKHKERHVDVNLIEEVRQTGKLLERTCLKKKAFYYNYLLKKVCGKGKKKAYIWGAGMLGNIAYDFLTKYASNIDIIGFLDGHKEGLCQGLPIQKTDYVDWENNECMVFIAYGGDVQPGVKLLQEKGLTLAENIWIIQ